MSTEQTTEFVPVNFLPAKVDCERRTDGTIVLRSPQPLGAYARCLGEHLERWAQERPETIISVRCWNDERSWLRGYMPRHYRRKSSRIIEQHFNYFIRYTEQERKSRYD
jgi:hypothetical protein